MIRALRRCVALLSLSLCLEQAGAQSTRVDVRQPTGPMCGVGLVRSLSLGSSADEVSPTPFQVGVTRDSRGRLYVAPTADLATFAVYDSTGKLLRVIGREGAGPGEYGFIMRVEVIPGDSLVVLDVGNSRMTVLSPSYQPVRSVHMPGRFTQAKALTNGRWLVNGAVRAPAAAGLPVHILDTRGEIERSFGSERPEVRRERPQADLRLMAPAPDGTVWLARLDQYLLERWSLSGSLAQSLRRTVEWFPPRDYGPRRETSRRPDPQVLDIWLDESGRLWTIIRVASSGFRAVPRTSGRREQAMPPFELQDTNHDVIVEVIDLLTSRLVATQRLSEYLIGHVGDGKVFSLRSLENGD
jgi:hypothetical protein